MKDLVKDKIVEWATRHAMNVVGFEKKRWN